MWDPKIWLYSGSLWMSEEDTESLWVSEEDRTFKEFGLSMNI